MHTHTTLTASPPDDLLTQAQTVVGSLQVLEIVASAVDPSLKSQLLSLLPLLLTALCSHFTAVRHMAARCITTMAQVDLHHTMEVGGTYMVRRVTQRVEYRTVADTTYILLCELVNSSSLQFLVSSVLPYLSDDSVIRRQGAIEAIVCILAV